MIKSLVRFMIYPVPAIQVSPDPPESLSEMVLQLSEGVKIHGWYNFSREGKPVLVFFHGNAENLETLKESGLFRKLELLELNYLAYDYPGYGKSTGKPAEKIVLESSREVLQWVTEQLPDHMIILCGWSLGAAVAIQTAARYPNLSHGLIAMSSWSSLKDVAVMHYPDWMVKILLKENYNSLERVKQIEIPALLIHGSKDRIIPPSQGQTLAQHFPTTTRWVEIPHADHNSLLSYPEVWDEIMDYINQISS